MNSNDLFVTAFPTRDVKGRFLKWDVPPIWEKLCLRAERNEDGCFIWKAKVTSEGYGVAWLNGRNVPAHKAAWEHFNGKVPKGLVLDHYRLNPGERQAPCSRACIEPAHLEVVSNKENVFRARKTHCPYGHPYVAGVRTCLPCGEVAGRIHYWRNRVIILLDRLMEAV